jgi:hypothetical protein
MLAQGAGFGVDDAFRAYALCSAIDNDTTSGRATELIVVMNWRLDDCEGVPDVLINFLSCSCRIASSASSSLTPGPNDRCILSVTPASVVGPLQASQAAPAVEFNAKTASFSASTMTVEPSGSLFITKASELVRSICIVDLSFSGQQVGFSSLASIFGSVREFACFATNIFR